MQGSNRRDLLISTRARDADWAEIAIVDSGPGLTAESLENLFKPFVTTKSDGMGVGLSISRTIIEAHGGEIWAKSSPNGAAFYFTLPRFVGEDADA
jgi:two-component system sensor kinase FixL